MFRSKSHYIIIYRLPLPSALCSNTKSTCHWVCIQTLQNNTTESNSCSTTGHLMGDLKLLQQCHWRFTSSGASGSWCSQAFQCLHLQTPKIQGPAHWRRRQQNPSKCWKPLRQLQCITSQKTSILGNIQHLCELVCGNVANSHWKEIKYGSSDSGTTYFLNIWLRSLPSANE